MKTLDQINKLLLKGIDAKSGLSQPDTQDITGFINQRNWASRSDIRSSLSLLPLETDSQSVIIHFLKNELVSYQEQITELKKDLSTESIEKANYLAKCQELEDNLAKSKKQIAEQAQALLVFRSETNERWKLLGGSWLPGRPVYAQNSILMGDMVGDEPNSILLSQYNALKAEVDCLKKENLELR
jgi:hypothetical protein